MARIERIDAGFFRFYPRSSAPVRVIRVLLIRSLLQTHGPCIRNWKPT